MDLATLAKIIDATYIPTLCIALIAVYLMERALAPLIGWFASMLAVVAIIKRTVRSRRPDFSDYLSFPSGHSATASFAAVAVILCVSQRGPLTLFALLAALWALAVGWSRVRLMRHRTIDVLAGLLLGGAFAGGMLARHQHKKNSPSSDKRLDAGNRATEQPSNRAAEQLSSLKNG